MLRCLLCGRSAWPTMLAKGQIHGHSLESLILKGSRGRGKGIIWERRNRSRDRDYLRMWRELLKAHLARVERDLENLGEIDDAETILPEVRRQPRVVSQPRIVRQPRVLSNREVSVFSRPPVFKPKVSYGE